MKPSTGAGLSLIADNGTGGSSSLSSAVREKEGGLLIQQFGNPHGYWLSSADRCVPICRR